MMIPAAPNQGETPSVGILALPYNNIDKKTLMQSIKYGAKIVFI